MGKLQLVDEGEYRKTLLYLTALGLEPNVRAVYRLELPAGHTSSGNKKKSSNRANQVASSWKTLTSLAAVHELAVKAADDEEATIVVCQRDELDKVTGCCHHLLQTAATEQGGEPSAETLVDAGCYHAAHIVSSNADVAPISDAMGGSEKNDVDSGKTPTSSASASASSLRLLHCPVEELARAFWPPPLVLVGEETEEAPPAIISLHAEVTLIARAKGKVAADLFIQRVAQVAVKELRRFAQSGIKFVSPPGSSKKNAASVQEEGVGLCCQGRVDYWLTLFRPFYGGETNTTQEEEQTSVPDAIRAAALDVLLGVVLPQGLSKPIEDEVVPVAYTQPQASLTYHVDLVVLALRLEAEITTAKGQDASSNDGSGEGFGAKEVVMEVANTVLECGVQAYQDELRSLFTTKRGSQCVVRLGTFKRQWESHLQTRPYHNQQGGDVEGSHIGAGTALYWTCVVDPALADLTSQLMGNNGGQDTDGGIIEDDAAAVVDFCNHLLRSPLIQNDLLSPNSSPLLREGMPNLATLRSLLAMRKATSV